MNTPPAELEFHRSTEAEHDRAAVQGGWVECWIDCPVCGSSDAHRHYICTTCAMVDFENHKHCIECWNMKHTVRIGRELREFVSEHGMTFIKMGFRAIVIVLFVLSSWRSA